MLRKDHLDQPWNHARTVDPREIERFTALAAEWWKPDGKFRTIHKFNPVRRDYIVAQIARHYGRDMDGEMPFAGLRILDVGCGAGLLCEPLAALGASVVGIDATARNVEIARWHAAENDLALDYRHCLAEHVLEAGEQFDVVLNTEVVEHVADPKQLMRECSHLVASGGIMIVATLNRTLRAFVLAIVGAEYVLRWLPKGTHDWRRFLKPAEIGAMIRQHGLSLKELVGVSYNPLRGKWRLSNDASVNYMLLAKKSV